MNFMDLAKVFGRDHFQPIAYPTSAIAPLMVISNYNDGAIPLGKLQGFMKNVPQEVPKTETEPSLNALEGKTMMDFKAGFSADLGVALKRVLKLGAEASHIASLQYRFADIQHSYILPRDLTKFLCASEPDPSPDNLSYVRNQGQSYIVSDVLTSGVFGIIAFDQNGNKVDIEGTASGEAGDAGFKLNAESKKAMEGYTLYNNPGYPHAFAVRALPFWSVQNEETGKYSWRYRRLLVLSPGEHIEFARVKPDKIIVVPE